MMITDRVLNALLLAGAGTFAAAWVVLLWRRRAAGVALMAAGWLVAAVVFTLNWMRVGEPPLGNMYQVQVVLALCFLPMFGLLARREGQGWTGAYFAFTSMLPLVGAFFMDKEGHWRRMPALQSPWFVPHVVAYMIGYALAAVGFAMMVAGRARVLLRRRAAGAADHAEAAYQTLRTAFPFLTFGMLSGALWAEEAWGVYWSWDPKETWSLITWALYAVYFHCRADPRLQRHADAAHTLAFGALLTTFTLVNILPRLASALHSYA